MIKEPKPVHPRVGSEEIRDATQHLREYLEKEGGKLITPQQAAELMIDLLRNGIHPPQEELVAKLASSRRIMHEMHGASKSHTTLPNIK